MLTDINRLSIISLGNYSNYRKDFRKNSIIDIQKWPSEKKLAEVRISSYVVIWYWNQ